jgi:hypothetical protein
MSKPTINSMDKGAIGVKVGTATASSGAATLNSICGTVTSESLTTAAGATYTLTLTNAFIAAADIVLVSLGTASGGTPVITSVTPAAGSVVIVVQNIHASSAFDAALEFNYVVVKRV